MGLGPRSRTSAPCLPPPELTIFCFQPHEGFLCIVQFRIYARLTIVKVDPNASTRTRPFRLPGEPCAAPADPVARWAQVRAAECHAAGGRGESSHRHTSAVDFLNLMDARNLQEIPVSVPALQARNLAAPSTGQNLARE
jgi:hypothetical protein